MNQKGGQSIKNYDVKESVLKSLKIPAGSRKVLVKILNKITDQRTPSGLIKIAPTDVDWNPARHTNRMGMVMAVPRHNLPFRPSGDLMPWKTRIQLSVGMTVWFDFMQTETYSDEHDNEYKLVDYDSCYVATFPRVDGEDLGWAHKSIDGTEWILPLNGFHLFERVYKKQRGSLDVFESMKVDKRKGIVRYTAVNNEEYETGGQSDHLDLNVGDEVQFSVVPEVMLEDESYCVFDGGKMYRRAQSRNVDLAWRDGELILPKGKCLIKHLPDETITEGGIILLKRHVKNHRGRIVLSSIEGLEEGTTIKYILSGGTPMKYNNEDVRVLNENHVLYVE